MRPATSYRGAKNRDFMDGRFSIGADGSITTKEGKEIPIRRIQSICAAKKRIVGRGKTAKEVVELCTNTTAKALKAYSRSEYEAMNKTPSRRPRILTSPIAGLL